MHRRVAFGIGFTAVLFFLIQLGALALVPTFYEQGYQTVEDPTNPTNSLLYIGAILVATAVMLPSQPVRSHGMFFRYSSHHCWQLSLLLDLRYF
jgi:hypothetical protein